MSRSTLRPTIVAAVTGGFLALAPACANHTPAHVTQPAGTVSSTTATAVSTATAKPSGLKDCELSSLPSEAATTVRLIRSGGPFPYQRDGVTFGNFEHRLPQHGHGYYHEYTVPTPGAKTRGTRRIITGGTPVTQPPEYYYTGDHYETFCQIGGA